MSKTRRVEVIISPSFTIEDRDMDSPEQIINKKYPTFMFFDSDDSRGVEQEEQDYSHANDDINYVGLSGGNKEEGFFDKMKRSFCCKK